MDIAVKKTPEEWLQFITKERKTYNGVNKYKYWMQLYRRAADSIPADEFAHNNNAYAKIMVDFAKLQARTSEDDARNIFQAARSNVKHCSLVYVAWAQFELLNNNPKKCKKVLEKGKQFCAVPGYLLDVALENFNNGNDQLIDDETEEHTFTELINKNTSKTEDFGYYFFKTKQRTSDSSSESTSSSVGAFSPEPVHSIFVESSEDSDDMIYKRKHSTSKTQSSRSREESHDENVNASNTSTKMNSGKIVGQANGADLHSLYSNNDVKRQLDLPAFTMPTNIIGECIIAGNKETADTVKPTSNAATLSQLTTRSSTGDEVKLECSMANNDHNDTGNQSEPVKENLKEFDFAIPVFSTTRKKKCSSGSSESSDDIDALLLKKSLLNIGNKTGLMDFATPQNKSKTQVGATRTDNNIVGGSTTKQQRLNVRGKRLVPVGLPLRVPKVRKDEIGDKDGKQDGTNDINSEMIEFHNKTKGKDDIDGVFPFPEDNYSIDVQGTHVNKDEFLNTAKNKKLHCLSKSKPASNIYTKEIPTQPSCSKKNHVGKINEHDSEVNGKSNFKMTNRNDYSYDSNKLNKYSEVKVTQTIKSTDGPLSSWHDRPAELNLSNITGDNETTQQNTNCTQNVSDLHPPTSLVKNAVDTVRTTPDLVPSEHQLRNLSYPSEQGNNISQECSKVYLLQDKLCQLQKINEASVCTDVSYVPPIAQTHKTSSLNLSGYSNLQTPDLSKEIRSNSHSSHHPTCTQIDTLNLREISAEINRVNPIRSTSKPKSVPATVLIGTTCNTLPSTKSGFQAGMQDISQITDKCSGRNITVNGKVYKKLNMIGRGGSSEVFTVFDADYAQYALKYVNIKDADASIVQSYVNEITLLKRLQGHESIIKLYDWEMDEVDKVIKIVLERGSTDLAGYLKKHPRKITMDFIKMCWRKMLDAVDVIHKDGIIHSDLKPANFLLVEWNLKLIDFGIANAIQGDVTSFFRDSTFGTLSYMSPEALKDVSKSDHPDKQHKPLMKIGRPSDVWSLGCILYLMVYGKTPFQHIKNNFHKWSCIVDPSHEIKFPCIENQDLLDSMKGCLRRNPSERYTIRQLQDHPFLTGRTSANDVDNVLNCIMQMQDINSPRTLRTFAQSLVGHLSSGSSLNTVSMQSCQNSMEK